MPERGTAAADSPTVTQAPAVPLGGVRGPFTTPAGPSQAANAPQATTPVHPAAPGSRPGPSRPGPTEPETAGEASQGAAASDDTELTVRTSVVEPPTSAIQVPEQRGGGRQQGAAVPRPGSVEDGDEDDEQTSRRVRVVLAERKGVARPVRTVVDIQEGTGVGELLRTNLIGSQLAVALRFAVGAGLTLGLLPLLFAMVPEIGRIEVLGLRLPWLLLGVLVYPFLFLLGWWHTRTAERVEQNFADHVQD